MISATSSTRMSSPFLSSAARAAIRDLVTNVGSGHTLPCCGVIATSVSHRSRPDPSTRAQPWSAAPARSCSQLRCVPSIAATTPATAARSRTPICRRRSQRRCCPRAQPRAPALVVLAGVAVRGGRHAAPSYRRCARRMPRRGRGNEEVDRRTGRDPSPQVGRRELHARHRDPFDAPAGGRRERLGFPVDDRERHEVAQLVDPVPRRQPGRDVAAEHEEQLAVRRRELVDGVDRVRRAVALELDPRRLEPAVPSSAATSISYRTSAGAITRPRFCHGSPATTTRTRSRAS